MVVSCANDKSIVVLVGWLFAFHIFQRDADTKSHGLTFEVDGVAGWPVGTPTCSQSFLVRVLYRVLDVDDTC